MYSCWQGLWGIICCLSLLLGMASCQDFTDDTGRTMPEPDLKFADGTLNLPLEEKEYTVDIESNLPWRVKTSATWIDLLSSNGKFQNIGIQECECSSPRSGNCRLDYRRCRNKAESGTGRSGHRFKKTCGESRCGRQCGRGDTFFDNGYLHIRTIRRMRLDTRYRRGGNYSGRHQ